MLARGAQIRLNDDASNNESWSKPIVPITNGYGYLDLAWTLMILWAAGGNGTLLVSNDGGDSWLKDPVGSEQPNNFTRFELVDGKGFLLGGRGCCAGWADQPTSAHNSV